MHCALMNPVIVGSAGSQNIAVTMVRDYGLETRGPTTVSMAASGSETRVTKVNEGIEMDAAGAVRVRVGNSAAISNAWTIDAVAVRVEVREAL